MSQASFALSLNIGDSLSRLELTEQDILSRLRNTEDSTVERKTASGYRDCLKTAVAFSNSLPVYDPGFIFVGVGNDGTVQDDLDLDSLQRKVSEEISKIYPAIFPQMKVMKDGGKEFLVVIVRGSPERPHFSGPSYVRDGMQTNVASEQQFARLIAERSNKVREILKWRGQQVTLKLPPPELQIEGVAHGEALSACVLDCNQFYATVQITRSANDSYLESFPLPKLEISFDPKGAGRLRLVVTDWQF